jgi:hypothetical protein
MRRFYRFIPAFVAIVAAIASLPLWTHQAPSQLPPPRVVLTEIAIVLSALLSAHSRTGVKIASLLLTAAFSLLTFSAMIFYAPTIFAVGRSLYTAERPMRHAP